MSDLRARMIGSWILERAELLEPDGRLTQAFGTEPQAHLFYTEEGYVSLHVTPGGDPEPGQEPFGEVPVSIYSYSGSFSVEDDKVTHAVEISMNPGWVGAKFVRGVQFEGELMVLLVDESYVPNRPGKMRLVWRRAPRPDMRRDKIPEERSEHR